jgi:hypothetical protein
VTFTKESGGRTYFRIADGNSEFVGQTASLKTENALKYLMDTPPTAPATVKVKYTGAPVHRPMRSRSSKANCCSNGHRSASMAKRRR